MMLEYSKLDNIAFEVLNKDFVVSKVTIRDGRVDIERFTDNPVLQPFGMENITVAKVNEYLESRCFDPKRADADKLMKSIHVKYYNPLEIIRKTHGRIWDDFTWIRFPGESLVWEDVANGRL